jgi:hypothetical protein
MNIAVQKVTTSNETVIEKEQFWKGHSSRQKESGLSGMSYCRKHQLNYDHFSYWGRKFREQPESAELQPVHLKTQLERRDYPQVEVLCTLVFKNGHELKIHDKGILAMLLSLWG